jgi:hypothetical protein
MLLYGLVFIGDHVLNYHTGEAIVGGAVVGVMLALVFQTFLYVAIVPTFRTVLRSKIVQYLAYEDTLCYSSSNSPLVRYVMCAYDKKFAADTRVSKEEVFALVQRKLIKYLSREHRVYDAASLERLKPVLFGHFDGMFNDGKPLHDKEAVRRFVADHL